MSRWSNEVASADLSTRSAIAWALHLHDLKQLGSQCLLKSNFDCEFTTWAQRYLRACYQVPRHGVTRRFPAASRHDQRWHLEILDQSFVTDRELHFVNELYAGLAR